MTEFEQASVTGVIHAKGSSERAARKNFCLVDKIPLFLCQAINLGEIIGRQNVYIDSESPEILTLAAENGFQPLERSPEFSCNQTGGVRLLKNFAERVESDFIVQLFPPMPLIDRNALAEGIVAVKSGGYKSAAFFTSGKAYHWINGEPGYQFNNGEIPNSVDLPEVLTEFPTAYVVERAHFLKTNVRVNAPHFAMKPTHFYNEIDIDHDEDFDLIKASYTLPEVAKTYQFSAAARCFTPPVIFWDVDGTLTDGMYPMGSSGEVFKNFNTFDGIAFKDIAAMGIKNCIVTASKSAEIIERRARMLNADILLDVYDKASVCGAYARSHGFNLRECFFVGNDVNDLEVMHRSGRAFCPWDSDPAVLRLAEIIQTPGRTGLVRGVFEKIKSEKYIPRKV